MNIKQHTFTFGENEEDALLLTCGKKLFPVNIVYESYGKLSKNADNAILVCHALTGDSHAAGISKDDKTGWWDEIIGPGKYIDTDKYFVICSNVIGSCYGSTGPSSLKTGTNEAYKLSFPMITISDMVDAQERLMQYLKIPKWVAVIGGSMGGMQTLDWAVRYPNKVQTALPIATTARLSPQAIAFDWVGREAIMSDPNFKDGNYIQGEIPEKGLAIARMLGHITYLSESSMRTKFGRRLQKMDNYNFEFSHNFAVESYLQYKGKQFVDRFDPNAYLYISRAMDYFNLAELGEGDLGKAMEPATCSFLVISFSSDWLFPSYQSMEIVQALQSQHKDVSYCEIKSDYGHDAFLLEVEALGSMIKSHLKQQEKNS